MEKFGEDGNDTGLFEMITTPYVGSGVLASSAAMIKLLKSIVPLSGIPVAEELLVIKVKAGSFG
jgi:D-alanine-D-alanine ligase-like ATP-grasp enzyme